MATQRKNYVVSTDKAGLNLREKPSKQSRVLALLPNGAKVVRDNETAAPDGWMAVKGGGFVMTEFLK